MVDGEEEKEGYSSETVMGSVGSDPPKQPVPVNKIAVPA
jgi:hypothetical protein